jgi:hypothetical protein
MRMLQAGALTLLFALVMAIPSQAADVNPLWGHWSLISAVANSPGQAVLHPFGEHPTGSLIYSPEGHMSALISYDGRPRLSADRASAPVEERAQAFATFFAYAGTYRVKGDTVIHHIEVASVPNQVGTDFARTFVLDQDRLTLRVAPRLVGGQMRSDELVWRRTPSP